MNPIATFLSGTAILMLLLFYVGTTYQTTKRFVGTLLILGATLFAILSMKLDGMKLGIDLQGGSEFVVQLQKGTDSEGKEKPVLAESVQQAIAILEKRLNPGAEKDLLLQPQGEDKVLIQMPGVTQEEIAGVRNKIEQVAKLEFRLVHPQNSAELARTANGGVVVGYVKMKVKDPKGEGGEEVMLVKNRADMDGKSVTQAFATLDGSKGWMIILKFDGEGAKLFGELTAANVNKRLAVVVDGEVISAPNLNEAIYGGSAEISGSFTETSARSLASALENPLENPMIIGKHGDSRLRPIVHRPGQVDRHCRPADHDLFHALHLPCGWHRSHHRLGSELDDLGGCDVALPVHADHAGYRRLGADHRYGGGCERADL